MIRIIIGLLTTSLLISEGQSDSHSVKSKEEFCQLNNVSFHDRETLVYKVYYNLNLVWIPAAEVEMNIIENNTDFEVHVYAKSYPAYDNFFRVRDYFYSRFDKKNMLPKEFVRIIEERSYRKFDSIYFDYPSNKALFFNGKFRNEAEKSSMQIDGCLHDLISSMYSLRNVDQNKYKVGDEIEVDVIMDKERMPVKVKYGGIDKNKKIKDLGKFNTIRVEPTLLEGEVFGKGGDMKIWVTNDKNKIPLLIETPVRVGSVKAVLKSWKNLRNPSQLDNI